MMGAIKSDMVQDLARVHVPTPEELAALEEQRRLQAEQMRMHFEHNDIGLDGQEIRNEEPVLRTHRNTQRMTVTLGAAAPVATPQVPDEELVIPANINRNAPCPCGSGLKYKQCHGKLS